jgi:hypothetical protein
MQLRGIRWKSVLYTLIENTLYQHSRDGVLRTIVD